MLVASEDALDQFFMREPELLMNRRVEAAILDHANPRILDGHVRAAAFEAPLDVRDEKTLGPEALWRAPLLPDLKKTKAGWIWAGRDFPAAKIGLRDTSGESFLIVDAETGDVLGSAERERAYSTVHEGAIYLHLGQSYRVLDLDHEARAAIVERFEADYYTQAKKETNTVIDEVLESGQRLGLELSSAACRSPSRWSASRRRRSRTAPRSTSCRSTCPRRRSRPRRSGTCPNPDQLAEYEEMPQLLGTLHAAEHAMIAILPLWAMCDRWDIGGLSTNVHFQTGRPTIFVYDGHAGGVGLTKRGYDQFEGWVEDTARMLAGCPCDHGCPSCVQSPKCGNLNEPLDKAGALSLLERMLSSR